jgi:flagellin
MALAIATNNAALNAAASASSVNRDMETSMARLSSGKRINSASDDAAGVAISSRLSAEIRGTDQAIRNSMDGQALIDTAEGAHKEVENILQRMREVAVQAANDTNNGQDRTNLQAELDAMIREIDRIAATTTWAGAKLMEAANGTEFSFQVGVATGLQNQIKITIGSMGASALGFGKRSSADITGISVVDSDNNDFGLGTALGGATNTVIVDGVSLNVDGTQPISDQAAQIQSALTNAGNTNVTVTAQGGDFKFTYVANATGTEVAGANNARHSMKAIDAAIENVNIQRSKLGAISNRLNHTVNNLTNISSNLSAAKGGIEDADFALETTNLAKNQILQQASTAMLAQANASKQNVLSLLQE